MVTSSVFVIANDVTPGLGLPVAAPGLRSFGMAEGLRNHGLDVTIIVPKHLLDRLWNQSTPPPMQPGIIALNGPDMAEFIESRARDCHHDQQQPGRSSSPFARSPTCHRLLCSQDARTRVPIRNGSP